MTRSNYSERQEQRRARLLARADKAEEKARAAEARAQGIAGAIPMGQPILVGRHSERRHRRDLERIRRGMRLAISEQQHATDLRRQASAVGYAGISSDDPEVVAKLTAKLDELEALQESRKKLNAAWRRAGRPLPGDDAAWGTLAHALGLDPTELTPIRDELQAPWRMAHEAPFPTYAITNTSAEMRRVRERIAQLGSEASRGPVDEDHGVCRLIEDPGENRVRLVFQAKPQAPVRDILKRYGFRWSPQASAWQRHLNAAGRQAARTVVELLREGPRASELRSHP